MAKTQNKVSLYTESDMLARFKTAAKDRGLSLSGWILQACISYAATHEKNNKGKYQREKKRELTVYGYPLDGKCFICKETCHEEGPLAAHGWPETYTVKRSELDYGFAHNCEDTTSD